MSLQNDSVNQPHEELSHSGEAVEKRRRSVKKIVGVVAVCIIALVVGAGIFVNVATKAPLSVSNQFLNKIQSGNSTAAYALFSLLSKATVNAEAFTNLVNKIGPILSGDMKVTSKTINGRSGSAATSEIDYEIQGSDGATYRVVINLVKENDSWKVLNFDSKVKG